MADKKMEVFPSAIASATILGAGVVGLAFGQLTNTQTSRSSSVNRTAAEITHLSPPPRPTTSAVDTHSSHYSDSSPISNPELFNTKSRRSISRRNTAFRSHFFSRKYNNSDPPDSEETTRERKESVSSRPSFLKRLSTYQNSQASSPRSSIAPDSPSFSHGSAAPILNTTDIPIQLPPNKLVKRASPRQSSNGSPSSHKEHSYTPSLRRRPATSHQRTATLQQQFQFDEAITPQDQSISLSPFALTSPQTSPFLDLNSSHLDWTPFFVSRIYESGLDILPKDLSKTDGTLQSFYTCTKRILPRRSTLPFLITSNMVRPKKPILHDDDGHMHDSDARHLSEENSSGDLFVNSFSTHQKPHRTLSKHFTSPPPWRFRSGSIGRRQGQSTEKSDGDENVPISVTASSRIPPQQSVTEKSASPSQMILSRDNGDLRLASNTLGRPARRNTSTLPPLPRVSSLSLGLEQIGSSSSSSNPPLKNSSLHEANIVPMQYPVPSQSSEFGSSPPAFATTHLRLHRAPDVLPSDRASTLVGSDNEVRGFYSGEDEDTDFQSETIFDSFRTGTTGSLRIRNPLESMFDTSPSSSLSQSKMTSLCDSTLRGSFHEGPKIAEEECKPVAANGDKPYGNDVAYPMNLDTNVSPDHVYVSSPPVFPLANEDFGRLSLEDEDDDEDWAKEAEDAEVRNPLSPPSSAPNPRHVSPTPRAATFDLANGNTSPKLNQNPYNRLFQWSETQAEKKQYGDVLERPKTEHGVQGSDSKGLRRKTPSFLLRSHSVPVVPDDVVGRPKTAKVTEEWEDDFFEHSDEGPDISIAINIPLAIQASQASILGHTQMIRDVKPIVRELKRLYTLAREKHLLKDSHTSLCDEAEGIIALADNAEYSPIDKNQASSPSVSPTSIEFDPDDIDDRFRDCGFDGDELEHLEEVLGNNSDVPAVRRQSVFLPGDDIFGHTTEMVVNLEVTGSPKNLAKFSEHAIEANLSKPSTFPRISKDPASVARFVMEQMHSQRSISDPLHSDLAMKSPEKMPFDTTSLKDLITRANGLVKSLNEIVQTSEFVSQSPVRSPPRAESPAFTRVFTDPLASPPRRLPRSKSNTSNMSGSQNASPTKNHGKRIHVMTVS